MMVTEIVNSCTVFYYLRFIRIAILVENELFQVVAEPRLQLCTRAWGHKLKRRLGRIEIWAEKQGLELAADCHLARIIQV